MDHYFLTLIIGGGPLCTIQRLKLKFDRLLSNLAFSFNLRRYSLDMRTLPASSIGQGTQDWFNSNIGSFVEGAYEMKVDGLLTNEWDTHM